MQFNFYTAVAAPSDLIWRVDGQHLVMVVEQLFWIRLLRINVGIALNHYV